MKKQRPEKPAVTIRRLREAAGLTQQEAGDKIGYSRSAIQKFELGRRTPPARIMPLIVAGLK
jgi:transcriptional regulator with XRE-family HTH domain